MKNLAGIVAAIFPATATHASAWADLGVHCYGGKF
jgi:hypothetical protein